MKETTINSVAADNQGPLLCNKRKSGCEGRYLTSTIGQRAVTRYPFHSCDMLGCLHTFIYHFMKAILIAIESTCHAVTLKWTDA